MLEYVSPEYVCSCCFMLEPAHGTRSLRPQLSHPSEHAQNWVDEDSPAEWLQAGFP